VTAPVTRWVYVPVLRCATPGVTFDEFDKLHDAQAALEATIAGLPADAGPAYGTVELRCVAS
jgi:hypothetical protein